MSYAQSIDGLNIEVTTGKVAQSIDSLDMLLSASSGEVPEGIILISPANGEINVSVTTSFDWDSSTAYDAYTILIDADENFSSPIEAYVTVTDYAQTTALLSATGYFWKVVGGNVTDRPAIVPPVGAAVGEGSKLLDEQALNDLYASTQGNDIPAERILSSTADLPIINESNCVQFIRDQEFYVVNGDVYKANDGPHVWLNVGPIWKNKTGWNNGNVTLQLSNYDAIAGVKVEELTINGVTELRVTGIDFQKLNYTSNENVTAGNNLVGTLPETMGNLRQIRDRLNLKQNLLHGDIPHSMYTYPYLKRWSVAGQCAEIDLTQKSEWYENVHSRDYGVPETQSIIGDKRTQVSNRLGGTIPSTVNLMQELELFECRVQRLRGNCPDELLQLPKLVGLFISDQRGTASTDVPVEERAFGGPFPQDWSQMTSLEWCQISQGGYDSSSFGRSWTGTLPESFNQLPKILNISVSKYLSGLHPTFPNTQDLRYYGISSGFSGSAFPLELFRVNTRRLSKVNLNNSGLVGKIGEKSLPTTENEKLLLNHFSVYNNAMSGTIPQWIRNLDQIIILNLGINAFTGVAPWELQREHIRLFRIGNNKFSGEVKAKPFSTTNYEAQVTEIISGDQVRVDFPTQLYTGTIDESSAGVIREFGATHPIEWNKFAKVRIIIPEGTDITFTATLFFDNNEYIYPPSSVDTSNTNGRTYEVTLPFVESVFGFEDPSNAGYDESARHVLSYSGDVFTLNESVDVQVGQKVRVYVKSDILYSYMMDNSLYGKIPEAHSYTPTNRPSQFLYNGNDFGWDVNTNLVDFVVPDFTNVGKYVGGSCDELRINNNRLIPYHILPNHTANQTLNRYSFGSQKKFSAQQGYVIEQTGGSVTINLSFLSNFIYPGDELEWRKNDIAVDGTDPRFTTNPYTLEISGLTEGDTGTYNLVLTNPSLPNEEFISGDQILSVTDNTQE